MSLESILAVVRDILVIAYMFVLRIGVPLLLTLMIGAWLRRLVEDKEEKVEKAEQPGAAAQPVQIKTK